MRLCLALPTAVVLVTVFALAATGCSLDLSIPDAGVRDGVVDGSAHDAGSDAPAADIGSDGHSSPDRASIPDKHVVPKDAPISLSDGEPEQ